MRGAHTERTSMDEKQIEIYKVRDGEIVFDVDSEKETIWATQEQMSDLFDVDRTVIGRHLRNIFRDGELEEERVCAKNARTAADGKVYQTKMYNLDAIISVGYRVNSRKATDFRIWATKILKSYVVDGVAINKRRLEELDAKKLAEIQGALGIVKRLMIQSELSAAEANGVLEVIAKYSPSFRALKEFDEGHISFKKTSRRVKMLSVKDCVPMIDSLRRSVKGGELFGKVRGDAFESSLGAIEQTFSGRDLYPTVAEKAANLLYLIIKDHPFYDGNKRIGALLFIMFLTMNDCHLSENGETKISDRALTALALLIAESNPAEKELITALICKLLEG